MSTTTNTSINTSSIPAFSVTPFDSGEGAIAWDYCGGEHCIIPSTIDRVGLSFAENNQKIQEVTIEEGVISISPCAFSGCTNLKRINLPTTLREMPASAFDDMKMVLKQNPFLKVVDGVLYNPFTLCALCCIEEQEEVSIMEDTVLMGWNCFAGNSTVRRINLPSSLKRILGGCFMGCENLEGIQLPEGLEYLGSTAFFLTGISSLRIPEGCELAALALLNQGKDILRI